MDKEDFKKIKNYARNLRKEYKELSCRTGALIGIVKTCEDLTRQEKFETYGDTFL